MFGILYFVFRINIFLVKNLLVQSSFESVELLACQDLMLAR